MVDLTTAFGPVPEPKRIATLDALRGVAIFGIFMVNIGFYAGPLANAVSPTPPAGAAGADLAAWAIVKVLFEYKFISTFSLLFGMGLAIQMQRAEVKGVAFVPVYLRRIFVLMAIGLVHGIGLWYGDILFLYSYVALAAIILRKLAPKILLWVGAAGIVAPALISGCLSVVGLALMGVGGTNTLDTDETDKSDVAEVATETEEPAEAPPEPPVGSWERFRLALVDAGDNFRDEAGWARVETMAYKEGPWTAALLVRAASFLMIGLGIFFSGFVLRVLGFFLIGIALIKLGFFEQRRKPWHLRMAAIGLPVGLIAEIGAAALNFSNPAGEFTWRIVAADPLHQLGSVALCMGYVGGLTLLASARPAVLLRPFEAVGRLALTNYLLQTVISTFIMYWWGLALFAEMPKAEQLLFVVGIFAVQVVASVLYLRLFTIGPMEWLWRSLTYGKRQPLLRLR